MNYRNYQTEDFLADEEFKLWVLNPTEDRNDFWQSWLKAYPEKKATVQEAAEIIKVLKFRHLNPSEQQYEEALGNILKADQPKVSLSTSKKSYSLFSYLQRVAAVILVIFTVGYLWLQYQPEEVPEVKSRMLVKENPLGHKSTFSLPDGTVVNLNAGSSLTFPSMFIDSVRMVELTGEAFFEVKHDTARKFVVKSGNIYTTALGTSFNVRSFSEEDKISIALVEGKVRIETDFDASSPNYLLPGEKLVYDVNSRITTKSGFNNELITGWKEGLLVFEDADLNEFILTLERWYGVKFQVEGLKDDTWHIKGKFDNESLEEILEGLSFSYDLDYEINKNIVKLKL